MDSDPAEPTLPPIPTIPSSPPLPAQDTGRRPARPSLLTRKRTHSSYITDLSATGAAQNPSSAASSDPAFFSGDESAAPGAEDYERDRGGAGEGTGKRRRKKIMYSGSWWNHQVKAGRREQKRVLSRNFDSGVWMGRSDDDGASSGSGLSSDSLGSMEEAFLRDWGMKKEEEDKDESNVGMPGGSPEKKRVVKRLAVGKAINEAGGTGQIQGVSRAREIVYEILDSGKQDVNLSGMGLSDLPSEVAQLATLTTEPPLVKGMLDHGRRFTTQLTMLLSNNLFTRVPSPLLELQNLRVLTLRNNKLTSVPPGIRRLTKLVELNVSHNRLEFLPFEIVELARFQKLERVYTSGNRWLPTPGGLSQRIGGLGSRAAGAVRRWRPDSAAFELQPAITHSRSGHTVDCPRSGAPSLTELVLRRLQLTTTRSDLSDLMPEDTPASVLESLHQLHEAHTEGGRLCTACKRPYVLPASEWDEWWQLDSSHEDVPFRRALCAQVCHGGASEWLEREWGVSPVEVDLE